MSRDDMAALERRLANDDALRAALMATTSEERGDAVRAADFITFATDHGFDITLDDLFGGEGALSETELEGVAGGAGQVKVYVRVERSDVVPVDGVTIHLPPRGEDP